MLKVLIVDDESNGRETLERLLSHYNKDISLCESCSSVSAAVKAIKENRPEIVLLDIELGSENGFQIFEHFPEPTFHIVFITAYEQYAVKAFRFSALDYLLKPVDPDQLTKALKKADSTEDHKKTALKIGSLMYNVNGPAKDSKKIVLKTADTIHLVSLREIMYCKADRSYTTFYLADKSHIVVSTALGSYEELFSDYGFFRAHQSFLLNLDYFKRYEKGDGGKAILKDGTSLPVATRKKDQLLQLLANL